MRLHPEIAEALQTRKPVVALESTVITHGLPRPTNLELARTLEATVRQAGAIPATIAVVKGQVVVGLEPEELEALSRDEGAEKASLWNLGALLAQGKWAGTTVAATAFLAHKAGIPVFATGGIGGVHPHPYDESADLLELSRTPILVVSAGPKSILNLAATLERLETFGVALLGYRTNHLPAFHSPQSPYPLPARVESPEEAARAFLAARGLGLPGATLVLNPISQGLPFGQVQRWVEQATQEAARAGVIGKALTPFLLRRISELSGGQTDVANLRLLQENARLAAEIARALAQDGEAPKR
ncbi:MAG: pseudouridine-5'-phosphate glycosidase [Meiothermus sp.]|uniref:pseudouridine-5'-phosphate glycosidase n=1 Tax=Meiothermus sp. TaxID=1955249 RepID=UPI0025DCA4EF|nr:pseudouridine-5'-phosphate glycosidase [Meiothermus sp.]MCS7059486.1 pseudouridine-5'-phosphate glycosidase [Meiothermus sp.]MCS7194013.1 pseudouridine-5'-phosphate glycosidase [Meiothermus sp.]MDW8090221.1 pseudouridine-5'-phosphate glycosidase [Meiothermus sp.]MDW8481189.1 pseudouridine-5'-phosphate glycosidase [Meiothermus sp.]